MNEILLYKIEYKQKEIKVHFDGKTLWLTQFQMAALFKQTKQNISLHINNCFK
ncbi:MAG: hypothetical protein H0V91_11350 [Flavisolibacter sp.]|nr:hypothetical protein [Flavisolibacter sp.]